MRRTIFILCIFFIVVHLLADGVQPAGSGIESEPYLISTLQNILWVSTNQSCWTSYFHQTADIDATDTQYWNAGEGFNPIGNGSNPFQGTYNGNNHTIDGIYINRPVTYYVSLFGNTYGADIENLGVTNVNINGAGSIGGLVGYNAISSTITNSYATGTLSGDDYVGGLVGRSYDSSTITSSYANCNVSGEDFAGGLVGRNYHSSSIINSYAIGFVYGNENIGGLVGKNEDSSIITNSYATGNVYGTDVIGGLVGNNASNSAINNSIWNIETSGQTEGVGLNNGNINVLVGKTTAEMQMMNTYTDIGWDFVGEIINGTDDVWDITESVNNNLAYISVLSASLEDWILVNFEANNTVVNIGDEVQFSDLSLGEIENWFWDFNDDGTIDSEEQNPEWSYFETGVYSVRLTVSNDTRYSSTALKMDYITVNDPIQPLGSGTETDPYLIATLDNLLWVSTHSSSWSSYFLQTSDIDATETQYWNAGEGFNPIGNDSNPFQGTYNGNNHTIDGININRPVTYYVSLFGNTYGADIENLGVTNVNINGYEFVGGLVGWANNYTIIQNSYATGLVSGIDSYTGGLVGRTNDFSIIENSYATVTVQGHNYVGGLLGSNSVSSSVSNSYAEGIVVADNDYVGGLVGYNQGIISNSYAAGNIEGYSTVGGLVGKNGISSIISNSYATGSVSGGDYTGGFVGQTYYSDISNSYATGSVSGSYSTGGFVGNNYYSDISNSYATGSVSGSANCTGGFVGLNNNIGNISNSYATGSVSGSDYTGGFIGDNYGGTISYCIWNIGTSGQNVGSGSGMANIIELLGKTTPQMQIMSTYTNIGWDFVGETVNGIEDIWDISSTINDGFAYISALENSFFNADFEADNLSVNLGEEVQFTDLSNGEIISWSWDFDNDGIIDSYEQNPVWEYAMPGVYSVSLTVSDENNRLSSTELKENYIEVIYFVQYGDIDNTGDVDSYDASLILMYLVGMDPLPEDPIPWEDWKMERADVDLDGEINALDAAYILQYVVLIIDELPVSEVVRTPDSEK